MDLNWYIYSHHYCVENINPRNILSVKYQATIRGWSGSFCPSWSWGFEVIDRVTVTVTWAELWANSPAARRAQSTVKRWVQSTNSRPFDENCKFTNFTLITEHESRTAWSCRSPILIPILQSPRYSTLTHSRSGSRCRSPSFPLHNHHLHLGLGLSFSLGLGLLPQRCCSWLLAFGYLVSKSFVSLCASYLTFVALWNLIIYTAD